MENIKFQIINLIPFEQFFKNLRKVYRFKYRNLIFFYYQHINNCIRPNLYYPNARGMIRKLNSTTFK